MKLFNRYNSLNITATIITFIIGSCTFYFLLNYILIAELDERLQTEQQEILVYAKAHNALPEIIPSKEQFTKYEKATSESTTRFINICNEREQEPERLRAIAFTVLVSGDLYLIKVGVPLEETEALLKIIIWVTVAMIAVILLIGYLINRVVIHKLLQPFYETINKLKHYHVADQGDLKLEPTNIDEFSLLNQSINEMLEKIRQDYGALKDFTGQAAHEMQTPLAIIRSKLDMVIQNDTVLEKNAQYIADIEKAVYRLSRLHKSLLLLTKVEHKQFLLNEQIQLDIVIEDKYSEYAEMAEGLHLNIVLSLEPTTVLFHHHLAEILISNLFNNAIRYNIPDGDVEITLKDYTLTISNASSTQELDHNRLFKRFYRNHYSDEGNGLGLSIVKQICDLAGYTIKYQYDQGRHYFTINLIPLS